ncbi:MAG TPA: hypothetical protein PLI15_11875, partial [Anaerolineales bacterium]|nr:hypothetical protein [Anaerolineales bacterium]
PIEGLYSNPALSARKTALLCKAVPFLSSGPHAPSRGCIRIPLSPPEKPLWKQSGSLFKFRSARPIEGLYSNPALSARKTY